MWFLSSWAILCSKGSHLWKCFCWEGLLLLSGLSLNKSDSKPSSSRADLHFISQSSQTRNAGISLSLRNVNAETHMLITSWSCWKLPGWSSPTATRPPSKGPSSYCCLGILLQFPCQALGINSVGTEG